jgi:hypothetical protein
VTDGVRPLARSLRSSNIFTLRSRSPLSSRPNHTALWGMGVFRRKKVGSHYPQRLSRQHMANRRGRLFDEAKTRGSIRARAIRKEALLQDWESIAMASRVIF